LSARKNVASCDSNGEGGTTLVGTGAPLSCDRPLPSLSSSSSSSSSSPRSRSLAGPRRNSPGPGIASTARDDANDVVDCVTIETEEPFGRGGVPATLLPPLARLASDRDFSLMFHALPVLT
jgi:hypothetical protein